MMRTLALAPRPVPATMTIGVASPMHMDKQ